jgi:hypothetical protein
MIAFGYKGAFLFIDHDSSSPERWRGRVHWTKFHPTKLVFENEDDTDRYWYSVTELRADFNNSPSAFTDRKRDLED